MKRTLILVGLLAVGALICAPAMAQTSLSLYEQEGTGTDGHPAIDASGQGGADANTTNWKYQYGGGSYSAIYGSSGWVASSEVENGDSTIEIECDIELYYSESFENNKIYVHLGDPFNATTEDKTVYVDGNYTSNNGMYIGISFDETGKDESDLEVVNGDLTGVVFDAMVGTVDAWGRDISPTGTKPAEPFDVKITLSWDNGQNYHPPVSFGSGSHDTILNTLWWLVDDGNIGSYDLKYKIELLAPVNQADGTYFFDLAVVASPML